KPASVEAAVTLAELYLFLGRWTDAETRLQQAIGLDPGYAPALLRLGTAQIRLGKTGEAEQTYRRVSSLPDKQFKHLHAAFLFQQGKREEAVKELEKLAAQDKKNREIRNRLVTAYLLTDRSSDAEKILTAALNANPRDTDALLRRVPILLKSGKDQDAK